MTRSTRALKRSQTRRLPTGIVPLVQKIRPPGRTGVKLSVPKTRIDKMRFKDAAQASNMTPADIARGHGIYPP